MKQPRALRTVFSRVSSDGAHAWTGCRLLLHARVQPGMRLELLLRPGPLQLSWHANSLLRGLQKVKLLVLVLRLVLEVLLLLLLLRALIERQIAMCRAGLSMLHKLLMRVLMIMELQWQLLPLFLLLLLICSWRGLSQLLTIHRLMLLMMLQLRVT